MKETTTIQDLQKEQIWCTYMNEQSNGSIKKVPLKNGKKASVKDDIYMSYSEAKEMENRGLVDGIGIRIDNGIAGIDLDHVVADGKLSDLATKITNEMQTYAEYSPSKTGIHLLFMVEQPTSYDTSKYYIKNNHFPDGQAVECYVSNRFLTFTGESINNKPLKLISNEELQKFLNQYMVRNSQNASEHVIVSDTRLLTDDKIIELALNSKNGSKFRNLYSGTAEGYKSESEADLGLCGMLAFWTGKDPIQMDRLFRSSARYRDKWDERHGARTYGQETIEKAITGCQQVYKEKNAYVNLEVLYQKIVSLDPYNQARFREWNDVSNARLFSELTRDTMHFVPEQKSWYIYDGIVWKEDVGGVKASLIMQMFAEALARYFDSVVIPRIEEPDEKNTADREVYDATIKGIKAITKCWFDNRKRKSILEDARGRNAVPYNRFDQDNRVLNVANGTLVFEDDGTVSFHPHNPDDYCSKYADVEYNAAASSERWNNFLHEIMLNDPEKEAFLQKVLGYALTGDTQYECCFMFLGTQTRNGKSTLIDSVLGVYGDYGTTGNADTVMLSRKNDSSGPSEDLARLRGIRFLNVPEPPEGITLNVAKVKMITGNDPINCRFLNRNSFTYFPQFKFILNTNHSPNVNDQTLFASDRIFVITFDRHFSAEERDTSLKTQFSKREVRSAILNWLIDGWKRLQREGMSAPKCIAEATADYKKSQDKIGQYIAENLVQSERDEVKSSDAYAAYSKWAKENSFFPMGNIKWKAAMQQTGIVFQSKRPANCERDGFNPTTMIIGYKLDPAFYHSKWND